MASKRCEQGGLCILDIAMAYNIIVSIPRRHPGFKDFKPSQLFSLVVARAPLVVYKYLSSVTPF